MIEHAQSLGLVAVQLHGNEQQDYIDRLRAALPTECQIWLAKGVNTDLHAQLPTLQERHVDYFVLDCNVAGQCGGTGQSFDWRLLDALSDKQRVILAGGIQPNNIATAAACGIACVDINSGVESQPGIKDKTLLCQAFSALRQY